MSQLPTLVEREEEHTYEKDRRFVRRSRTRKRLRLGGRGQDLRTGVTDTDWIYGCLPASTFNLSVFLICLCSYCLLCLPRPYAGLTYSIVLTIVHLDGTPTLSLHSGMAGSCPFRFSYRVTGNRWNPLQLCRLSRL